MKTCPHCRAEMPADATVCPSCGADMAPVEPASALPRLDRRALALWALLVVPGFAVVLAALFLWESTALLVLGLVMLAVPLLVQLFGADWGDVG